MKANPTAGGCSEIRDAGHVYTATVIQLNAVGTIDVCRGKAGRIGLDACLTASAGKAMLKTVLRSGALGGLYVYQSTVGGRIAIDAQVSAPVAAKILAQAKRAGVCVRE
jgi:hypothetical protein